ncbi:hypothetical protein AB0D12_37720 [Streptomyces sp. NPDC048479]|uniref:hypothetical protein n=1 Tax=Streptomyces sp. NPDC048479 TaxID=3154725 RepID=UPI0034479431
MTADGITVRTVEAPRHLPTAGLTAPSLIRRTVADSITGLPCPQPHRTQQTRQRVATGTHQVGQILTTGPLHRPAGDTPVNDYGDDRHAPSTSGMNKAANATSLTST